MNFLLTQPGRWCLSVLALVLLAWPVSAQQTDLLTREREEQTGTAITILFDNSGSMNAENKIGQAKSAFTTWLQAVPRGYKFSLITFENTGRLIVPLGENTRELVGERVAKLIADTNTPICGALQIARAQIEKRRREVTPYERHVVLVFTDGGETVDHRGAEGVQAEITELRRQSVEVVGIGFHGQGDYMREVATRFALAGDEQELARGLAQVDAEIGAADDLMVSPEDLAALKKAAPPAPQSVFGAVAVTETADPAAEAAHVAMAPPVPAGKRSYFPWIVGLIVGWVLLRSLTSKRSR